MDILHFHLTEFEEIFNKEPKEDGSNAELLGIYSLNIFSFKLLKDGEENKIIIKSINFPQVIRKSLF